jgi:hypothetical protein
MVRSGLSAMSVCLLNGYTHSLVNAGGQNIVYSLIKKTMKKIERKAQSINIILNIGCSGNNRDSDLYHYIYDVAN